MAVLAEANDNNSTFDNSNSGGGCRDFHSEGEVKKTGVVPNQGWKSGSRGIGSRSGGSVNENIGELTKYITKCYEKDK